MLQVGIAVECDQIEEPVTVTVSFATGTVDDTRGLFLATFERPAGPTLVVTVWADALTAFAWESLLTLASKLAAAAGLIAGIWIPYLGLVTTLALVGYFVAAITAHVRAHDLGRNLFLNAVGMLVLCIGVAWWSFA